IESWVYQIARNIVADFYRRSAPRPTDSVEGVAGPHSDCAGNNSNRAVGAWLSLMIESLPPALGDAVCMYEVDGLSQAEIARRLGISLSGAKSRVQRGRRQLARLLHGSCQLELDRRGNVIACKPATEVSCGQVECECQE